MKNFAPIFGALTTNLRVARRFFHEEKGVEALVYFHLEPEHHEQRMEIAEIAKDDVIAKACYALTPYLCPQHNCPPPPHTGKLLEHIGCVVIERNLLVSVCDNGPRAAFKAFKHEDLDYCEIGVLERMFNDETLTAIEPLVDSIEHELALINQKMFAHR